MAKAISYCDKGPYHWKWFIEERRLGYILHVNTVIQWFKDKRGTVLDLGCGDSLIGSELLKANPNVFLTGVDIDPEAIMLSKNLVKSPRANFLCQNWGKITHLRYDYVICSELLEHLDGELLPIVGAFCPMAVKGLYLTTPNALFHLGQVNEHHSREYTSEEILPILNRCYKDVELLLLGDDMHFRCLGVQ